MNASPPFLWGGVAVLIALAASPASASTTGHAGGPGAAAALQQDYVRVVGEVKPSVVQITTSEGLGSGIVYDHKGDIVTNDHVVLGSTSFHVQLSSGGVSLPAKLVGSYPPRRPGRDQGDPIGPAAPGYVRQLESPGRR